MTISRIMQVSFLIAIQVLNCCYSYSQKSSSDVYLHIIPKLSNTSFVLEKKYPFNSDSIQFEIIKFYISNIELLLDGKTTYKEKASYHLVDFSNPKSLSFILIKSITKKFNTVKFNIGIDSITNVSGAFGGDLDPTKAMYWTWQNGYINTKLEGSVINSRTNSENKFEYHLGGYQYPTNTLQQISFNVTQNSNIEIDLDLEQMIAHIEVEKQPKIMSPSPQAVQFSEVFSHAFSTPKSK